MANIVHDAVCIDQHVRLSFHTFPVDFSMPTVICNKEGPTDEYSGSTELWLTSQQRLGLLDTGRDQLDKLSVVQSYACIGTFR